MATLPPSARHDLLAVAHRIDSLRAAALTHEVGTGPGRNVAILLATAYPALRPSAAWQLDAVSQIAAEGWRVPRGPAELRARLFTITRAAREEPLRVLRRQVWAEKARIALRELLPHMMGGATVGVTAAELSHLADAALEVALAEAMAQVATRFGPPRLSDGRPSAFVVLGMGKLGGQELNAGSDVDVVFCYDSDDGGSELSLYEHWTRVAQRTVATLDEVTGEGRIWRVDLRLRPEGSRGPLVNSLAASERYYETWGALWERAALLRARPVAGDPALGAVLERELLGPFVYRRTVDPSLARGLVELVHRSRVELSHDPARDLKLGPGGIREAEFFVQTLQLIWGGKEPSLRVRGTHEALARLRARGLVTDREGRRLAEAYTLLRACEHAVQWSSGVQTHLLPSDPTELGRLARCVGYADGAALEAALSRARADVSELFASLLPEGATPQRSRNERLLRLLESDDPALTAAVEARFGVDITEHLQALARRPDGLLGEATRERYPELGDRVLDAVADASDPERAARTLRGFFGRLYAPGPYLRHLARDGHAVHRLASSLGASEFVGDAVVARPDLADLVLAGQNYIEDPRRVVEEEVAAWSGSVPEDAAPDERQAGFVSATRRAKQAVMVSVAVADLAGEIATREATRVLSELADAILEQTVAHELGGPVRGLAVIAMGKLGGRDIGYGSDLDVLFIYDSQAAPRPDEAGAYFARRAQRIMRRLQEPDAAGKGYELDTRLRPSGSHGLLVTSLRSFARYHGVADTPGEELESSPNVVTSGAAWERQALLRARFCAGDPDLGQAVIHIAHTAAYERGEPPAEELHHLRMRMERELGRERDARYDLKLGRGGLLDIEFALQWLQMRHGRDPAVRTTDTGEALEALTARGYLAAGPAATFGDGYQFLRRLEQRIHVLRGVGSTLLDARDPGLGALARRMAIHTGPVPAAQALLARYADVTEAVREAYLGVLGLGE